MIYLVEIEPFDPKTNAPRILRFGSVGYTTEPVDVPSNAYFDDVLKDPGNFERYLYGRGRTRGDSDVGGGDIQLSNADGELDVLLTDDLAFDGRPVRIYGLRHETAAWASREIVFSGVMEQVEFPSRAVTIRIRDNLELLRDSVQPLAYLGTTTHGGLAIAEGTADLKDVKKPLAFGRSLVVPLVAADAFDNIFQGSSSALAAITNVRDTGVWLTATRDHATLPALKAVSLQAGQYATCLSLGLVRTSTRPRGRLTADLTEGATLADRCAARIVQRLISGLVPIDVASFDALAALAPQECGFWTGTEDMAPLAIASKILASIGGWLMPNRLGIFSVGRLDLPSGPGELTIDEDFLLGGEAVFRNATSDPGAGVPARSVTIRYARAHATFTTQDLADVASDDPFRSLAEQEYRQEKVANERNALLHPKGPELVFDTCLLERADAETEARRLLAIHAARRDLFVFNCWSDDVASAELNTVMTATLQRFGMSGGRRLRILGMTETRLRNVTEIEAWG